MNGLVFLLILVLGSRHSAFVLAFNILYRTGHGLTGTTSVFDLNRIDCGTAVRRDRTTYLGCVIGIMNFIVNVSPPLEFNAYAGGGLYCFPG